MPDGLYAVSGSTDKTLRVWDLASGMLVRELTDHSGGISSVAVTRDGRHVVSAAYDHTIRVCDLAGGAAVRTLAGHQGGVTTLAIMPDGRHVVSGAEDKTLRVWDLDAGEEMACIFLDRTMNAVAVAPSPARLPTRSVHCRRRRCLRRPVVSRFLMAAATLWRIMAA